jgi:hypothetical protein
VSEYCLRVHSNDIKSMPNFVQIRPCKSCKERSNNCKYLSFSFSDEIIQYSKIQLMPCWEAEIWFTVQPVTLVTSTEQQVHWYWSLQSHFAFLPLERSLIEAYFSQKNAASLSGNEPVIRSQWTHQLREISSSAEDSGSSNNRARALHFSTVSANRELWAGSGMLPHHGYQCAI